MVNRFAGNPTCSKPVHPEKVEGDIDARLAGSCTDFSDVQF